MQDISPGFQKMYPNLYSKFQTNFNAFISECEIYFHKNFDSEEKNKLRLLLMKQFISSLTINEQSKMILTKSELNTRINKEEQKIIDDHIREIFQPLDFLFKECKSFYKKVAKMRVFAEEVKLEKMLTARELEKNNQIRFKLYEKITKLKKVFDLNFPHISGKLVKACKIVQIDFHAYSKWISYNEKNRQLFKNWKKQLTKEEQQLYKKEIKKYLDSLIK